MEREELQEHTAATEAEAGLEFDRQWARTVVRGALKRVAGECVAKRGRPFYDVIAVFIGGPGELVPQEEAAAKLGLGIGQFRTEIFTWRQKFRDSLRAEVRQTVDAPHEVEGELRYLWQLLTSS